MFTSLKIREFRFFWIAMFASLIGSWIQSVAQSWLVFRMTGSSFLLGLVGFLNYFPIFLLALAAGVFADRHVKRNLLIGTQFSFMVLAFILAVLVDAQAIRVWQILALAFLSGIILAIDAPARQAMVVELVGKQHLLNAIALNSAAFNSARMIGSALAGVMIVLIGVSGCFYVNALSYLPILAVLFLIKPKQSPLVNSKKISIFYEVQEAFYLIRTNQTLLGVLAAVGIVSLFGVSYIVLMPVFAQEIFHAGAKGLAVLMTANGIGALAGALSITRLKDSISKVKIFKGAIILFFVSTALYAFCHSLIMASSLLVLAGYGLCRSMSTVNTMLQVGVPDHYRGRVMGIFIMMLTGLLPFGNLLSGTAAYFFGARVVVFCGGLFSFIFYALVSGRRVCLSKEPVLSFVDIQRTQS